MSLPRPNHVEDIGFKGKHNGVLLAAISGSVDILVTGDTIDRRTPRQRLAVELAV